MVFFWSCFDRITGSVADYLLGKVMLQDLLRFYLLGSRNKLDDHDKGGHQAYEEWNKTGSVHQDLNSHGSSHDGISLTCDCHGFVQWLPSLDVIIVIAGIGISLAIYVLLRSQDRIERLAATRRTRAARRARASL